MNKNQKVTVVMPTYNGSKYIKRSIESILAQTHTNFEFIIVDDGSTDNTAEVIGSFKDDRIKYIYQENKGPASAYNTGFKSAATDFIFIMDHDDFSYPIRIEKQLEYLIKNNFGVCGSFFYINNEENGFIEGKEPPINDEGIKRELLFRPWTLFNPTLCVRKSVFDKYGIFDEQTKIGYDYKYFLQVSTKIKFGNVPNYLYLWNRHKNSHGSTFSSEGKKIYEDLSFEKLNSNEISINNRERLFIKGMVYYYSNKFFKSARFFLLSISSGYLNYKVFLYLGIVTLASPIVIFLRKRNLFSHPFIVFLKKTLK